MPITNSLSLPVNSHSITHATIINFEGARFDVSQVLQKLTIFEDLLDLGYVYGHLTILDDNALTMNIPIIGQESIELEFTTRIDGGAMSGDSYKASCKIISVKNLSKQKDNDNQSIQLDFVSMGFWESEKKIFSKSYRNSTPSEIVTDLFGTALEIPIDVEETLHPRNWVIPNKTAFEFAKMLTNTSTSKENLSSDFRLYENIDGWHFKSLYTLGQQEFDQRLNVNIDDVSDFDRLKASEYKKDTHFDLMSQMSGGLQITLDELDTIQRRAIRSHIDHGEYITGYPTLNPESIYLGEVEYPKDLYYRICPGNSIYESNRDSEINQRLKRIMNRALMDSSSVTLKIPGNIDLKTGQTVYFDFSYRGKIDQTTSGKYVICSIKHELTTAEYNMTLNIRKDSNIAGDKIEN